MKQIGYQRRRHVRERWRRWIRILAITGAVVAIALIVGLLDELRTSRLQARLLSEQADRARFSMGTGPSDSFPDPGEGPYDQRLGHSRIIGFQDRLEERGYVVAAQARSSAALMDMVDMGLYAPYHEKTRAGLRVIDREGRTQFRVRYPQRAYGEFDEIPPLVVETLLFLENRELLTPAPATRNPAVEWDRLLLASVTRVLRSAGAGRSAGGSTLATQIEKFRHSPEGVTWSPEDKLHQMASASLRAYLDGPDTHQARREIVLTYVNSVPLAAAPGHGEVAGLGDSLEVWYGADFVQVNRLLWELEDPAITPTTDHARAYRQVLSLFLSQKRPTHYLVLDRDALDTLTDGHLRLMAAEGTISEALGDTALALQLEPREVPDEPLQVPFSRRKFGVTVRTSLMEQLGVDRVYDLDRMDLTVATPLDRPAQLAVVDALHALNDPAAATAAGLTAHRLVTRGDPAGVIYSLTLYERVGDRNLVRIQADNLDQPLDINEGVKLELGSTAKLRTLVSYLEIVADLHDQHGGAPAEELRSVVTDPQDRLTVWALQYLVDNPGSTLEDMLDAALQRRYSASSGETFFTGGGAHRFHNFSGRDNGRNPTAAEALRDSINLPYIRIMRDVVRYHVFRLPDASPAVLLDPEDPVRQEYLSRFAEEEGKVFLRRFWSRYEDIPASEHLAVLTSFEKPTPTRLAVCFRSVRPDATREEFGWFLAERLPTATPNDDQIDELFDDYAVDRFNLHDRGYLAGVHPLELWLVAYRLEHPGADLSQILDASEQERQEVYGWLFRSSSKKAQDSRIRTMLEIEAFDQVHTSWVRTGYPFQSLVPSYATAIGSSGDRPAALAELMGIIVNDGARYPGVPVEELYFAENTPYETHFALAPSEGEQVLRPEVAAALRQVLAMVVERGTARRASRGFTLSNGTVLAVGGKTGTGDNQHRIFGDHGEVLETHVQNRTATFVFYIGDRHFGTVVAYVPGEDAGEYKFTSSLPVQVLMDLESVLVPVLEGPGGTSLPSPETDLRLNTTEPGK